MTYLQRTISLLGAVLLTACGGLPERPDGPYQATGVKVGEVTADSAVVWTRGTRGPERGIPLEDIDEWVEQNRIDNPLDLEEAFLGEDLSDLAPDETSADKAERMPWRELVQIVRFGAVAGADGDVAVTYWPRGDTTRARSTPRMDLRNGYDYTRHLKLENLTPGTRYDAVSRVYKHGDDKVQSEVEFTFNTAPAASDTDKPVSFTVITGTAFRNIDQISNTNDVRFEGLTVEERRDKALLGHRIFPEMAALDPDFLVNTGDVVYYDHQGPSAKSRRTARIWWQRMFSLPNMESFHRRVPVYFIKDDHCLLKNDCWPGQRHGFLTYNEGRRVYHEQTPFPLEDELSLNEGETYRTARWGKHMQMWVLETRDHRKPNTMDRDDPRKTMLGKKQLKWLRETLEASDATFKIVAVALPVVGPDRPETTTQEERENLPVHIRLFRPPRIDNLANETWHLERTRLLDEVFAGIDNVILVVGDRHWKYHSAYPSKDNPRVHEFSSGCTTDVHARSLLRMWGVPRPHESELLYWRDPDSQGGFLSARVEPRGRSGQPEAIFRFHLVDGSMAYPFNTLGRREVVIRADGSCITAPGY